MLRSVRVSSGSPTELMRLRGPATGWLGPFRRGVVAQNATPIAGAGRIAGIPCFHEGKVKRLDAWLADRGESLSEFAESYFYGDSQSDVPLLEKVTNPVVVSPDDGLAQLARERGWPIISLR